MTEQILFDLRDKPMVFGRDFTVQQIRFTRGCDRRRARGSKNIAYATDGLLGVGRGTS
jgi:hypothetical protein